VYDDSSLKQRGNNPKGARRLRTPRQADGDHMERHILGSPEAKIRTGLVGMKLFNLLLLAITYTYVSINGLRVTISQPKATPN